MSESRAKIPFVRYDADDRIDQDLLCLRCGYNLRTLHDDRTCPECGVRIAESARIGWLLQCDPAWLRKLARATIWMGIALVVFAVFLASQMSMLLGNFPSFLRSSMVHFVLIDVLAVGIFASLVGLWQFTAPHGDSRSQRDPIRRAARWTMAAGLAGFYLAVYEGVLWAHGGPEAWVLPCASMCLGVGVWAILTYAAELAAKIADPRLVRHLRIFRWGFALCILSLVRFDEWSEDMIVTIFAALIVLGFWTIPLLVAFRRRLLAEAAIAQPRQYDKARRHRRSMVIGVVLVLLSIGMLVIIGGWWREQAVVWMHESSYSSPPPKHHRRSIAPMWLVDRLPYQLSRFFYRVDGLTIGYPAEIAGCSSLPYLRKLKAYGGLITDADLVNLKDLSKLERLDLSGTQVTDAGLVQLKGLTKLTHLDLGGTQVTDVGLVHLKGLTNLKHLDLWGTNVTNTGVVGLKGMSLELLVLTRGQMTDAAIAALRQAMPHVTIITHAR